MELLNKLKKLGIDTLDLDNNLILYKYIEQDAIAIYDGLKVKDKSSYGLCSIGLTEEEFNFYEKNRASVINKPIAFFSYKNYYIFELDAFHCWVTYNKNGKAEKEFIQVSFREIRNKGNCLYFELFGILLNNAKKYCDVERKFI